MAENTNDQRSVAATESNEGAKNSCDEGLKVKSCMPAENPGYMKSLILRITHIWPLKYVFKMLKKIAVFTGLSEEVENVGTAEQVSPSKRRFVSGKKRIGRLTRLILLVTPYRIQYALGYRAGESIGKTSADDIRKSPLKPCGKGSKRKQDDLDMEEQHSWVALLTEDLPDEDQVDDPTYEPSISESDSEENKSKNDTESDLEVEEKDGVMMLKETRRPSDSEPDSEENKAKNDTRADLEVEEKNCVMPTETTQEDTQANEKQLNASVGKEPDCKEPNTDGEEQKDSVPTVLKLVVTMTVCISYNTQQPKISDP
ncbi:uncharacterized protein [Phyllobates terribilis]|uniref:uncharacterized protein n=1 Tax=Phyllobates terribilis TaxID=111132 RepID=UPI003CCA95EF